MSLLCNLLCDVLPCNTFCEAVLPPLVDRSERCIAWFGPLYFAVAVVLVLLDAWVFFSTVVWEINKASGWPVAALHACFGLWLLFNVLFNQTLAAVTSPGTTLETDPQELRAHMTHSWRWCSTCERGKPPLTHHCSICNKCVLKMDHHCPWMSNCIGFNNYRYFFLYLWWMWVGSLYSTLVTYLTLRKQFHTPAYMEKHVLPFVAMVLSVSVFFGLGGLLGWHLWLVLTGQGTIDAMGMKMKTVNGQPWSNPYNLGAVGNFKETFDVTGRFWMLTWMLPSMKRKRGLGYKLPKRSRTMDVAEAAV